VLHFDLHQELSAFPKLPSPTTRLFEYSNLWQTLKKRLTMEEMNSPCDEDTRITVPWLALCDALRLLLPSSQRGCKEFLSK